MERTTTWENIGVKASTNDFDTLIREADLDYTTVARDMYAVDGDVWVVVSVAMRASLQ